MSPNLKDPAQFDDAYRQLAPRAVAAANHVLRDEAAAEDVVQDVFMQLWRRPSSYDARRGPLSSYVTMLARSRALDRWRSRSARDAALERTKEEARLNGESVAESADELAIRRERSRVLAGAIGALPAEQRDALLLAYGRGLTANEIADAAAIPLGTAKSRVRLGLRRTRENLSAAA
ncbi:MAG: sigma-70 family RNA polymerase sigma factor [Actinomycetota bacterium]|nr:sigma-70 family RNA polymerase sigma factor [Actinomycetota bacterium]